MEVERPAIPANGSTVLRREICGVNGVPCMGKRDLHGRGAQLAPVAQPIDPRRVPPPVVKAHQRALRLLRGCGPGNEHNRADDQRGVPRPQHPRHDDYHRPGALPNVTRTGVAIRAAAWSRYFHQSPTSLKSPLPVHPAPMYSTTGWSDFASLTAR